MILQTVIYTLAIVSVSGLALLVTLRKRNLRNILYALFSVLIALVFSAQLAATLATSNEAALLYLRVGGVIMNFLVEAMLLFSIAYTDHRLTPKKVILLSIAPIIFSAIGFTNLSISSVTLAESGFSTEVGALYNIQTLFLVAYLIAGLVVIFKRIKTTQGRERDALRLVFLAILIPIIVNFITNVLLVSVAEVQFLAPLSLTAMSFLIGYAIAKHRLFDIKLVIIRALGYILSLATVALIYSLVIFGIVAQLFDVEVLSMQLQALYIAIALMLALTFAPLKRFFDRITKSVFYQDAYETKVVIDDLNSNLVQSYDLRRMISRSSKIIKSAIKVENLGIVLKQPDEIRQMGNLSDMAGIYDAFIQHRSKMVVFDELDADNSSLLDLSRKLDCGIAAKLETQGETVGVIFVGLKSDGRSFTNQDVELIRIVSDELAIAIQNALRFEEIQNFNIKLKKEVEEATAQLRVTNQKLRKLDEIKDEFVSMASHQLRTPLTSVKGYISMVLEGDVGKISQQQRELLEQAFSSTQRMVYLIGDFLNVSRLQTGKFVIEWKVSNLAEIVGQEIAQLQETAKRREIDLVFNRPQDFPSMYIDETKIHQVIMNFIDNALFYTRAGGKVEVSLIVKTDGIYFTVKDNGIGVPEAERHKLFTKFFRAENAKKARPDGTGVGLFMAKKVVTALGGSIIFESKVGKGSTFGFILPLSLKDKPLANKPS